VLFDDALDALLGPGVDLMKQFRPKFTDKNFKSKIQYLKYEFSWPLCALKPENLVQNYPIHV
jgi:hypothetical protein